MWVSIDTVIAVGALHVARDRAADEPLIAYQPPIADAKLHSARGGSP